MAVQFNVESFKQMKDASNEIRKFAEEYAKLSKRLMEVMSSLGEQRAYVGSDYDVFAVKVTEFRESLDAMTRKLETGADALYAQADNYEKTQKVLTDDANRL